MTLGLTHSLTEMSTRSISWGKCGRCVTLTTLPPSYAFVKKSGNLNFLELFEPLQAFNGTDLPLYIMKGTAVAQWLRYCAKNQKVAGSIPDGVMEFFIDINPSDRIMTLGLTHSLTEMSTWKISWGNCGRCVRLTTLPPSCAVVKKSGEPKFLEPSGPLQACNGTALTFFLLSLYVLHGSL
jgi:hypothetical protein